MAVRSLLMVTKDCQHGCPFIANEHGHPTSQVVNWVCIADLWCVDFRGVLCDGVAVRVANVSANVLC
jgi:hypothetical protein